MIITVLFKMTEIGNHLHFNQQGNANGLGCIHSTEYVFISKRILIITSWQNVYDLVKNVYNYVKEAECKTISTLCC